MPNDPTPQPAAGDSAVPDKPTERPALTPEAERALAAADARRAARDRDAANHPKESGGRGGLEPTRYGDWEVNGITSDF
jgi:hypothetical protein